MVKGHLAKVSSWRTTVTVVVGIILWLVVFAAYAQTDDAVQDLSFTASLDVQPPTVSPGDPIAYILTLDNPAQVDYQVTISATLPAGFELSLADLPAGASYNLRSGDVQWIGMVEANSARTLTFPGLTPLELRTDGRLTMYVALAPREKLDTLQQGQGAVQNQPADAPVQIRHLSATGWVGTPPTAAFTHILDGQTIQFANLSQGVGPLSAWWELGDGTTTTDLSPSHSYPSGGEYTVRLTIANPKGASTIAQTLFVPPPSSEELLPSPYEILVSDDTPAVGQPIYFSNLTEPISVSIQWNFGDGITSSDKNPTYIYQRPGIYTTTCMLGEGTTAIQSSRTLTVDYPPQATIEVARSAVSINELVTFNALTSAPEVMSYYWDFGDGNSAGSDYVAHSYNAPGVYSVTLAVSNDFGVTLNTLPLQVSHYPIYLPLVVNKLQLIPVAMTETVTGTLDVPEPEPAPEFAIPADPLAQQILQAINAEREAVGLQPLSWSDQLARSAQHHTNDMATHWFTGHYGSNGSRPVDRMRQASYTGDYAGECTGWGFDDIASAVAWWMTSPPHRVIVLSTVATELGGAYGYNADAPSVHYWTIDFGVP